jgi:hypothetical protein
MNYAIFNVLMHTVVYADPLEDQLIIGLTTKSGAVFMHLLLQSIADRQERAMTVSTGGWSPETSTYRKMGCFIANFSTPPLMMLVLKVTNPA